jgi:hypothetical protein
MPTNPYAPPEAPVEDAIGAPRRRMTALKLALLGLASLGAALVGGFIAASAYQRWKYPGVQDTDGLLDIGGAFIVGFVAVSALLLVYFLTGIRWRSKHDNHSA